MSQADAQKRKSRIFSLRMDEDDFSRPDALARLTSYSRGEVLRRCLASARLKSTVDAQALTEVSRVHADLNRIGGLPGGAVARSAVRIVSGAPSQDGTCREWSVRSLAPLARMEQYRPACIPYRTRQLPNQDTKPPSPAHTILFVGLLLLIGVAIVLIEVYAPRPEADSVLGGKLSDVTKKAIDLTVDLSKLFMTWSLALVAGAAIYLKTSLESGSPLTRTNLRLLEAIIVVCILSVFFGQAVITRVTNLLLLDVFPVDDVVWRSFQAAQYSAFLLSLLLVAVFIDLAYSRPIERRASDTTDGGSNNENQRTA